MTNIHTATLVGTYDLWLVALSVIIGVVTSYTALSLAVRIARMKAGNPLLWLGGGAVAIGLGIWSMHFVGMLALRMPMQVRYDVVLTLLSMLLAIAASGLALHIASRQSIERIPWLGGILLGLGITALHYTGMEAMSMPARIEYQPGLFLLSILVAIAASITALWLAFRLRETGKKKMSARQFTAAVVMGSAIAGMHYIGMTAVNFIPSKLPRLATGLTFDNPVLASGVATTVLLLLIFTIWITAEESSRKDGISTRVTMLAFGLVIMSASTIGIGFYLHTSEVLIDNETESMTRVVHIKDVELNLLIQTLRQDVLFLSQIPPIQGIIRARQTHARGPINKTTEQEWRDRLATIIAALLESRPDYLQARYIGIQNQGRELVRVERHDDKIIRVSEDKLQTKGHTDYIQYASRLERGKVYLSDVTLNREYQQIVKPYSPSMRAAAPIYSPSGNLFGVVVINMDFDRVLNSLSKSRLQGSHNYLTNDSGDLLGGSNPSVDYFGFEFKRQMRIQDMFNEITGIIDDPSTQEITTRVRSEGGELQLHFQKVAFDPDNPQRFLGIAETAPDNLILARTRETVNRIIVLTIVLVILAAVLALFLSRIITQPLRSITVAAEKFANGDTNVAIPQRAQGEIGILADTFASMVQQVNERGEQLKQSETFIRNIVDSAADGIITINSDGAIRSFNPAAEDLFGYLAPEVIGKDVTMLIPESDRSHYKDYIDNSMQAGSTMPHGLNRELYGQYKEGSTFPIDLSMTEMVLEGDSIFIGLVRDISKRKQAESKLRLAARVMDTALEGIMITDSNNNIQAINPAFSTITGYTLEEVYNKNPRILMSGRHDQNFYKKMWNEINQTDSWQGEIWDRRKNGEIYPKWLSISVIKNDDNVVSNYVAIFSDITERKMTEERLEYLAHYDPLTRLPNRLLFQDRLHQAIHRAQREHRQLALLFLDLDNFKVINDTLGHDVGDELLNQVAKRLQANLRESDTVARLAGDEFTVILEDTQSIHDAARIAKLIVTILSQPFHLKDQERFSSVSIGISVFPGDGKDPHTLLKNADIAMYRAKERGRNNFKQYNESMSTKVARRFDLETQLRRALEREEFELHYQPQINLLNGQLVGLEALLRWRNSDSTLIAPNEFIPIAETTGLIHSIGEWVLQEACSQHQKWTEKGIRQIRMAVNVSAQQLVLKTFPTLVEKMLQQYEIEPHYLDLELTESVFIENAQRSISILQDLERLGVKLSIDDFGTGYSSLSQLKRLPFQTVKIDRSFIYDITDDRDNEEIARAIIAMSHSLNRTVIAEGVETPSQLASLLEMQCNIVQGYLFSHALPHQEIEPLLNKTTWETVHPTLISRKGKGKRFS